MAALRRIQNSIISLMAVTATGALVYRYKADTELRELNERNGKKASQYNKKWNHNWDQRHHANVKGGKIRHVVLVRHGQYFKVGKDEDKVLTQKGVMQATFTGERLVKLGLPYTDFIISTMTRAQQTGHIILKIFQEARLQVHVDDSFFLTEGCPNPGSPTTSLQYRIEDKKRLDYAFNLIFHRADEKQTENTCTVVVCHANVIRYLVCRALQLPEEAWTRFMLHHASITWLSIEPDGKVTLRGFGESGHIPETLLTEHSIKPVHDI